MLEELVKGEDKESIQKQMQKLSGLIAVVQEKSSSNASTDATGQDRAKPGNKDDVVDAEFEDATSDEAETTY
ncbi:MAG: hypothetical protein ACI9UN_004752 [Granulosicoccus sp.]